MRGDQRAKDELRKVSFTKNCIAHAEGSVLVEFGDTKVICTASVESTVPPFLKQSGTGWVTAEYAMIPRATHTRTHRERKSLSGRTAEIQRLIGRCLRAVTDLKRLPERSILIDCDVICADGGTRTAAVTGGFIALIEALKKLKKEGVISEIPIKDFVAAVSLGFVNGVLHLDLEYSEDSKAQVDMNLVMTGNREIVEVQGTAEGATFSPKQLQEMIDFGWKGIEILIQKQREVVGTF